MIVPITATCTLSGFKYETHSDHYMVFKIGPFKNSILQP
jgi:hypothetical protein